MLPVQMVFWPLTPGDLFDATDYKPARASSLELRSPALCLSNGLNPLNLTPRKEKHHMSPSRLSG